MVTGWVVVIIARAENALHVDWPLYAFFPLYGLSIAFAVGSGLSLCLSMPFSRRRRLLTGVALGLLIGGAWAFLSLLIWLFIVLNGS